MENGNALDFGPDSGVLDETAADCCGQRQAVRVGKSGGGQKEDCLPGISDAHAASDSASGGAEKVTL